MECQVCLKKFNNLIKSPQIIKPCDHTICLECLSSLDELNCPICCHLIMSSTFNQKIIEQINQIERFNSFLSSSEDRSISSLSTNSSFDLTPLDTETNEKIIKKIDERFRVKTNNNPTSLLKAGRIFILESVFIKECKKRAKVRYFFLFNDQIVYGKKDLTNSTKLKSQHILPLINMKIRPFVPNDSQYSNGIFIMTPKKSFSVYANTPREKTEWLTKLDQCISLLQIDDVFANVDKKLAPLWTPDKKAQSCMRCNLVKFNLIKRRHHCRNCGYVVCSSCSCYRVVISNISQNEVRVCSNCYDNSARF